MSTFFTLAPFVDEYAVAVFVAILGHDFDVLVVITLVPFFNLVILYGRIEHLS